MKKENFVFFASFLDSVEALPEDLGNKLLRAIARYGVYGEVNTEEPVIHAILLSIMPNIIKAKERYEAAKLNGAKGGRPRKVDYDKVMEMLNNGATVREVAEELGCSTSTVYDIRKNFPETQKPKTNLDIEIDNEKEIEIETDDDKEIEKEISDRGHDKMEKEFWEGMGEELKEVNNKKELNRVIGELAPRFGWDWLHFAMTGRVKDFNKHGFGLLYVPEFQKEVRENLTDYYENVEPYYGKQQ